MSWLSEKNPFAVDRTLVKQKTGAAKVVPFLNTDPMFAITPKKKELYDNNNVVNDIALTPKDVDEAAVLIISNNSENKRQGGKSMYEETEMYAPISVLKGREDPLSRLANMLYGRNPFYVKMHNLKENVHLYGWHTPFKYQNYNVGRANITVYGPINFTGKGPEKGLKYYIVNDHTVNIELMKTITQPRSEAASGGAGYAAPASGPRTPASGTSIGGARLRTRSRRGHGRKSRRTRTRSKSKKSRRSNMSRQRI
jgi:hypothetical protein